MKKVLMVAFVVTALAATAVADEKTCGQMIAEKAAMPAKMSEVTTNVAAMMDAHATAMLADKTKESKQEAAALKKIAAQHKKLAAEMKKTSDMMAKASTWPSAPHDMAKLGSDPAIQKAMEDLLRSQKEFDTLLGKEISWMESMKSGGHGHKH